MRFPNRRINVSAFSLPEVLGAVAIILVLATLAVLGLGLTRCAMKESALTRELQLTNSAYQNYISAGGPALSDKPTILEALKHKYNNVGPFLIAGQGDNTELIDGMIFENNGFVKSPSWECSPVTGVPATPTPTPAASTPTPTPTPNPDLTVTINADNSNILVGDWVQISVEIVSPSNQSLSNVALSVPIPASFSSSMLTSSPSEDMDAFLAAEGSFDQFAINMGFVTFDSSALVQVTDQFASDNGNGTFENLASEWYAGQTIDDARKILARDLGLLTPTGADMQWLLTTWEYGSEQELASDWYGVWSPTSNFTWVGDIPSGGITKTFWAQGVQAGHGNFSATATLQSTSSSSSASVGVNCTEPVVINSTVTFSASAIGVGETSNLVVTLSTSNSSATQMDVSVSFPGLDVVTPDSKAVYSGSSFTFSGSTASETFTTVVRAPSSGTFTADLTSPVSNSATLTASSDVIISASFNPPVVDEGGVTQLIISARSPSGSVPVWLHSSLPANGYDGGGNFSNPALGLQFNGSDSQIAYTWNGQAIDWYGSISDLNVSTSVVVGSGAAGTYTVPVAIDFEGQSKSVDAALTVNPIVTTPILGLSPESGAIGPDSTVMVVPTLTTELPGTLVLEFDLPSTVSFRSDIGDFVSNIGGSIAGNTITVPVTSDTLTLFSPGQTNQWGGSSNPAFPIVGAHSIIITRAVTVTATFTPEGGVANPVEASINLQVPHQPLWVYFPLQVSYLSPVQVSANQITGDVADLIGPTDGGAFGSGVGGSGTQIRSYSAIDIHPTTTGGSLVPWLYFSDSGSMWASALVTHEFWYVGDITSETSGIDLFPNATDYLPLTPQPFDDYVGVAQAANPTRSGIWVEVPPDSSSATVTVAVDRSVWWSIARWQHAPLPGAYYGSATSDKIRVATETVTQTINIADLEGATPLIPAEDSWVEGIGVVPHNNFLGPTLAVGPTTYVQPVAPPNQNDTTLIVEGEYIDLVTGKICSVTRTGSTTSPVTLGGLLGTATVLGVESPGYWSNDWVPINPSYDVRLTGLLWKSGTVSQTPNSGLMQSASYVMAQDGITVNELHWNDGAIWVRGSTLSQVGITASFNPSTITTEPSAVVSGVLALTTTTTAGPVSSVKLKVTILDERGAFAVSGAGFSEVAPTPANGYAGPWRNFEWTGTIPDGGEVYNLTVGVKPPSQWDNPQPSGSGLWSNNITIDCLADAVNNAQTSTSFTLNSSMDLAEPGLTVAADHNPMYDNDGTNVLNITVTPTGALPYVYGEITANGLVLSQSYFEGNNLAESTVFSIPFTSSSVGDHTVSVALTYWTYSWNQYGKSATTQVTVANAPKVVTLGAKLRDGTLVSAPVVGSGDYAYGATLNYSAPDVIDVGGVIYNLSRWSSTLTGSSGSLVVTADITAFAVYSPANISATEAAMDAAIAANMAQFTADGWYPGWMGYYWDYATSSSPWPGVASLDEVKAIILADNGSAGPKYYATMGEMLAASGYATADELLSASGRPDSQTLLAQNPGKTLDEVLSLEAKNGNLYDSNYNAVGGLIGNAGIFTLFPQVFGGSYSNWTEYAATLP